VFPPQTAHGWHGRTQAPAEIVVVHVSPVPEPVRSLALARGFLQTKLGAEEKAELVRVASLLGRELARPTDLGVLLTERALLDLFLMSIRDEPAKPLPHGGSRERQIVEAAVAYFSEHIAEGPSLERVARAVHVSSSHLRRIFQRVRKISPRQAFNTLRLKRATELLRDERLSLEEVATLCGFSDASAFSRAFRRMHGKPPSEWRRGRG
jgi:transcriptional regulator GlxA family with amidase domain